MGSSVGVETSLPNVWFVFRIPVRDFSLLRKIHSGSGAQPAPYLWGTEFFSVGKVAEA